VLARVFERVIQRSAKPGSDAWLIEPENPREARVDVAERPLVSAKISQRDDSFGSRGIIARDHIVTGVAPLDRLSIAHCAVA
jgi:hypothetical protein